MTTLLAHRELFGVGNRSYDRQDAIIGAILRGEWHPLDVRVREGLACVERTRAGEGGQAVDIEAAADEFRYARDLISVEELDAWLDRGGVTFEQWVAHLQRTLLRRAYAAELPGIVKRHSVTEAAVASSLSVEAVCSGDLERFADTLAGRATVCERALADGAALREADEGMWCQAWQRCEDLHRQRCDLVAEDWPDRLEALSRLEATYQAFVRRMICPAAVRLAIAQHRLDWVRFQWRFLTLPDEDMSREVALCVRDAEPIEDVAAHGGLTVRHGQAFLSDLHSSLGMRLLNAHIGDTVGPLEIDGQFWIGVLDGRVLPSEDVPEIKALAERAVVEEFVREQQKRACWRDRLWGCRNGAARWNV